MNKRSWLLGSAAALVVLPVAGVAVAAALLEPNNYKPQVEAAVQRATGRKLTIAGDLHVSRSLWPTIEINNVVLANLPGGSRPEMAKVERIRARLSLPALLRRRIALARLDLIGPNILFEIVHGKPNWVFVPEQPVPAPDADTAGGWHMALRVQNTVVKNGMITNRLPARTTVIGIKSLDLKHNSAADPVTLSAMLVYGDFQPFSVDLTARPANSTGGFALEEVGLSDPWNTQISLAAQGATIRAQGTATISGDYDLQIDGDAPMLDKLNALLPDLKLPPLRQFTIATHLSQGPVSGDLPSIGKTELRFAGAALDALAPGLQLNAVSVSLPKPGGLATLSGNGIYANQAFTVGGTIGVPEHPDGRVSTPLDIKAEAKGDAPANLALKGKLALDDLQFNGLTAAAQLHAPDLAALRPVVSQSLPAFTHVALDGQLTLPADLGRAVLRDASLATDQGTIGGDITLGLTGDLVLDGQFRASRLNMDDTLTALGIGGPSTAQPEPTLLSDRPLDWAVLRNKTVNVSAQVAAMTYRKQEWRDVSLALRLNGGHLQIDRAALGTTGGPVELSVTADANAQTPPVRIDLHAAALPMELVARSTGLPGPASGAMKLDASLSAQGRSPHELAKSADGDFSATMLHGTVSNAALLQMASAALQALGIHVPPQGETGIRCFGVIGAFKSGVAHISTIALDSTYLDVNGAGKIDLGAETLALKLHPLARLSGSTVSVPVVLEGPLGAPKSRLDADGLDKLGLLVDAWFGGDHPETCSDAGLVAQPPAAQKMPKGAP